MNTTPVKPPAGWEREALTGFLDLTRANQFGTFYNKRSVIRDICDLDQLFWETAGTLDGPGNVLPGNLFHRSHSAYRAGAGLAMSGQCAEAPCLLRLCLECAGYAALMQFDGIKAQETFMRRMEGDNPKKAAKKAFTAQRALIKLRERDRELATVFSSLYESLIDFGAHPNELMISSNTTMSRNSAQVSLEIIYLHEDGPALDLALKRVAQTGICSLEIFALLFPDCRGHPKLRRALDAIKPRY